MKQKRRKALLEKRAAKLGRYKSEGSSLYARKHKYLTKAGLMGYQVPEPKPWR